MAATPDESHQTLLSKRDGSSSNLTIAKDPRASAKVEKKDVHIEEVRVRISIKRIVEVDLVKQNFTAEFFMEASWTSTRMVEEGKFKEGEPQPEVDIERTEYQNGKLYFKGDEDKKYHFTPRLSFRNLIEYKENLKEEWIQVYQPSQKELKKWEDDGGPAPHAVVCYRLQAVAQFQEKMELKLFPVDSQNLSLELMSGYETAFPEDGADQDPKAEYRVHLIQNLSTKYRSFVNNKNFFFDNEYDIEPGVKFEQDLTLPSESASNRQYPILRISAVIRRKYQFWGWNVVLPLFLLTSTSSACLAVPQNNVGDRTSITLTMMLTTVAYKYLIAGNLPNISYLTLIDTYCLFNLLIQVAFVVWTIVFGIISIEAGEEANYEFPPWLMFATFMGIWVGLHLLGMFRVAYLRNLQTNEMSPDNRFLWIKGMVMDSSKDTARQQRELERTMQDDYQAALAYLKMRSKIKGDRKVRWDNRTEFPLIPTTTSLCTVRILTARDAMAEGKSRLKSHRYESKDESGMFVAVTCVYESKDESGMFVVATFLTEKLATAFMMVMLEVMRDLLANKPPIGQTVPELKCIDPEAMKKDEVKIETLKREWSYLADNRSRRDAPGQGVRNSVTGATYAHA
eukprot:g7706.t1